MQANFHIKNNIKQVKELSSKLKQRDYTPFQSAQTREQTEVETMSLCQMQRKNLKLYADSLMQTAYELSEKHGKKAEATAPDEISRLGNDD